MMLSISLDSSRHLITQKSSPSSVKVWKSLTASNHAVFNPHSVTLLNSVLVTQIAVLEPALWKTLPRTCLSSWENSQKSPHLCKNSQHQLLMKSTLKHQPSETLLEQPSDS